MSTSIPRSSLPCWMCSGTAWWVSLAGEYLCENCHPPEDERVVARREAAGKPVETKPSPKPHPWRRYPKHRRRSS